MDTFTGLRKGFSSEKHYYIFAILKIVLKCILEDKAF